MRGSIPDHPGLERVNRLPQMDIPGIREPLKQATILVKQDESQDQKTT